MDSEGAISYDIFDRNTHYTLSVNTSQELVPIENSGNAVIENIPKQGCFYFLAGVHHTDMSVTSDTSYTNGVFNALVSRQNEGWKIPNHYLSYIKSL
jgi:hypothetical protein